MNDIREAYHPIAYLQRIKNLKSGLATRTKILYVLVKGPSTSSVIARDAALSYGVVIHHLRLLKAEGSVNPKGNKPYVWSLTGKGQTRLVG